MTRIAQRKVQGGKLVRVRVDHDGARTTRVSITGDFFAHPEEGLEELERGLAGVPLGRTPAELLPLLERLMAASRLELPGFGPRDLADLLAEASA